MLPYKRIVFVDIPDPDNFFMVLHILKSYPDERVAVVLNTRVLDLSVTRYDHEFGDIKNEFGMEQMAFPFEKDGFPESVPDDLAHFFRRDAGLEDKEVREDTRIYMVLSSLRLAAFLEENSVSREKYDMFLQAAKQDSVIRLLATDLRPSMHHPFHVDDFKFGFNSEELDKYNEVIRSCRYPASGRREGLRSLCLKYIERQVKFLDINSSIDLLDSLDNLIGANRKTHCKSIVIGGPFTEAFLFLKNTPKPKRIVAMAGSLKMDRNIFNNVQFNFWADLYSAEAFLELVARKGIALRLVPTECGKGIEYQRCPLELHLNEYRHFLGEESLGFQMIQRYVKDKDGIVYGAFDWIAAIASTHPRYFTWMRVKYEVTGKNPEDCKNIRFWKISKYRCSNMQMASGDVQHLEKREAVIVEAMEHAVRGSKHARRNRKDSPMISAPIWSWC
jgi:hypothetical protein